MELNTPSEKTLHVLSTSGIGFVATITRVHKPFVLLITSTGACRYAFPASEQTSLFIQGPLLPTELVLELMRYISQS